MTNRFPMDRAAFLLTLLLMMAVSGLFSLSGKLTDSDGKAISGAAISDKKKVVYSGADGSFSLKTDADSLFISRIGYSSLALHTENIVSPIILVSSEIVLPTVHVQAHEYRSLTPSLNATLIHPDTNAKVESAAELLLEDSSFGTSDSRLSGERQTLSLLGSYSRHALVMLDGVVLNPAGEAFDFSKLPWGQISHIELIKGNSSVYGGSAAIGGIIHLHSKSSASQQYPVFKLSAASGSFGLFKQSYILDFSRELYDINAEYTHQSAENDFAYDTPDYWNIEPELKRNHNRKISDNLYFKGSLVNKHTQADYSLNIGSFVRQLPGPISFLELFDASKLTGCYAQNNLRAVGGHKNLDLEMLLWLNSDQSTYKNLGSSNPAAAAHYTQKQLNRGMKAGSSLSLGTLKLSGNTELSDIDYRFENHRNGSMVKGSRENSALAFSAQKSFFPYYTEYKLHSALRTDYSENKLHPSWRIENELKLPFAEDLKLGAYLGSAFSQPSLFDMYWIGDSDTQGNPDLKSETSIGYSLYSELQISLLKLKLAYYHNRVENLIQWRQYYLNGLSWRPFNVGEADTKNWEAESRINLHRYLSLGTSLTYTEAIDLSKNPDGSPGPSYNKQLVYTPRLKAALKLQFGDIKQGITFSYSYTGEQYSTPDNLIEPLPAFDTIDANLIYSMELPFCSLQLNLKAKNLLNRHYEIYAYTPQPGFNWQSSLNLSTGGCRSAENDFQHRGKQR